MKIILADSNSDVRSALRLLLEEIPDVSVLAEVESTDTLFGELEKGCPDLILIDVKLPGVNLKELATRLYSGCPGVGIIALGSIPQMQQIAQEAGIPEFVYKSDPPESLLAVLDKYYHRKV
jgi:DNA-binding NarL/FixJ family response regulator